jgi:Flp pilus assembly protein TadD
MESSMRCSETQREESWRELQRRVRCAANDVEPPAAVVIDVLPAFVPRSRAGSGPLFVPLALAAGLGLGFLGGRYLQTEPIGAVTPEATEAAQLTRAQGALLMKYLDEQDLICDAIVEEPLGIALAEDGASVTNVTDDARRKAAALAREGRAARRQGNLAAARQQLEAALRVNPRDAGALNSLGRVAAEAGNRFEAEELFHRALALDASNAYAMVNLATLFSDRREYDRARALVEQAVRIDPALVQTQELASRLKSVAAATRVSGKVRSKETEHGVE